MMVIMRNRIVFLLQLLLAVTVFSCVSKPYFFNKEAIDRSAVNIAVLPFVDYSGANGAVNSSGELVRSSIESRMILKGFRIIELEKLSSALDASVLKKKEYSGNWIVESGRKTGADYMILGSVHDYRTYENITSFLYLFSWFESTSTVGVTARMVSCKTGEVVWAGIFTRSSFSYSDAANEAARALVSTLKLKKPAGTEQ